MIPLEYDIPQLVESLVQYTDPHNDEQDCSSAENYCVCESYDVTVGELQNTLTEEAAIVRAKPNYVATEEAPS